VRSALASRWPRNPPPPVIMICMSVNRYPFSLVVHRYTLPWRLLLVIKIIKIFYDYLYFRSVVKNFFTITDNFPLVLDQIVVLHLVTVEGTNSPTTENN
jgi:hypothetical protein